MKIIQILPNTGRKMKKYFYLPVSTILILGSVLLGGCELPILGPAPGKLFAPTHTPTPEPCAFVWASKELPEVTSALQDIFLKNNLSDVGIQASGFGENCLAGDGSVRSFGLMCVDLYLDFHVTSLDTTDSLAQVLRPTLVLLADLPEGILPAAICQVSIHLESPNGEKWLNTDIQHIQQAIDSGKKGRDFFQALFPE